MSLGRLETALESTGLSEAEGSKSSGSKKSIDGSKKS